MCVILNVAPGGATIAGLPPCAALTIISAKTKFLNQIKINSASPLINGISKLFHKLLKCFSVITTFASVNESLSSGIFPIILLLYLKDSELEERGSLGSSL